MKTTPVTHSEIYRLCKPGRVGLIKYHDPDVAQRGIQFLQGGGPEHAICLLGGFETVEEDILGAVVGSVRNYLRGQCDITIMEPRRARTHAEEERVERVWLDAVGQPYDYGMIAGMVPILVARKIVYPISHRAGRAILLNSSNLFASHTLSTCAELYARGQRDVEPDFLKDYALGVVTPYVLAHDARDLVACQTLQRPVLVGRR